MLVELVALVEQQRAAGLRERHVTEFVEDDEIEVQQLVGESSRFASSFSCSSALAGSTHE